MIYISENDERNDSKLNKESAQSIVKNLREKFGAVDKDIFVYAYPTEDEMTDLQQIELKKV